MSKGNTMSQRTTKENKLERNSKGKPKLTLSELEKTGVNTPTQEEYNTLMQVYECGGWRWVLRALPTQIDFWGKYKEETCIDAKNRSQYDCKKFYHSKDWKIISTQEFYDKQNVTPEMLEKINNYFETITKK